MVMLTNHLVALANKTALVVWAVLANEEVYRAPVAAAATCEGATAQVIEGEYGTTVGETGPEEPGLSTVLSKHA